MNEYKQQIDKLFSKLNNELTESSDENGKILDKYMNDINEVNDDLFEIFIKLLHARESFIDINRDWVPENDDPKEVIKNACNILDYSFKTLSAKIGVAESSLRSASSTGKVTQQVISSLKMLYEIECLKSELLDYQLLRDAIKRAIS